MKGMPRKAIKMMSKSSDRLQVLRILLGGLFFLMVQLTSDLYSQIQLWGVIFSFRSQIYWLLFGLLLVCIIILITLLLTLTRFQYKLLSLAGTITALFPQSKRLAIIALIILIGFFATIVLFPLAESQNLTWIRGLLFGGVVIIATILLRRLMPRSNWLNILTVSLLCVGITYRIFQFLPDISIYPFSLGWSEASRYYYASLFFSEKIYGFWVSPSTLHPTRYLMQSIPFLLDGLPLWFHRIWQVGLWLICSFGTAIFLARRLKISGKFFLGLFLAWVFLFMWQGPIYYHLLVMVIIILWGFDPAHFWQSLIIVALASIWAGISRVNWFPVPGMLAVTLYFLEKPRGTQLLWKYLLAPAIWTIIGFSIALGAQSLYIVWSGNDPELFASSFSSALLWYRLLPNATYPLGVLTGALLISLPVFIITGRYLRHRDIRAIFIELIGLSAILGVLFLGGLVVSTKIGGGSNLHNLDAYLALLLVIGSYFYFERMHTQTQEWDENVSPAWINLIIVFIPVLIALSTSSQFVKFDRQTTSDAILKIQRNITRAIENGGEILFISERQLLTFDYIEGGTLIPEYEKVILMEMVMADNQTYLDNFETDIRNQRFDLIITDPLFDTYKPIGDVWAEENNVWVDAVSVPLLCNYWRKVTFPESGVQILAPRAQAIDCTSLLDLEKLE